MNDLKKRLRGCAIARQHKIIGESNGELEVEAADYIDALESSLKSTELVMVSVRHYMRIHKGPWPPDTYISCLGKAIAAHDKETGALNPLPDE